MTTFAAIGINNDIVNGLERLGFTAPTEIQEQIIPLFLHNHADMVGLAQTGTGKTAAFGIPLVQLTDTSRKQTQALVLCPTRELCVQVARDISAFSKYVKKLKVVAVYGGASIEQQISSLRKGAHIIVATPGRLNDMIRRNAVDISAIRSVVLDEADEMLQMGFQDELNAILASTPDSKNTLLFSATMPKAVAAIAGKYMTDPVEITVGQRNAGSENVRHIYYMVHARDRYLALRRIADMHPDIYGIVFCRTRQETKEVADKLIENGYNADALHGDMSQSQRDNVMGKFRRKKLQMLVATDVAARGLDVNDLTHVINYNLPDEIANYTHRSGRTGRAGKSGISIAIIHMRERHKIREIEKIIKRDFEQGRIPSGHEICEKQLLNHIDTVKNIDVDHKQIEPFLAAISDKLASLDREELVKRFVSVEFNRFLQDYRNAPDLNVSAKAAKAATGRKKDRRVKEEKFCKQDGRCKFTRFVLNVGKKDGIHPTRLIGQINDYSNVARIKIGKIQILHNTSIIEADSRFIPQVKGAFEHLMVNGRDVTVAVGAEKEAKFAKSSDRQERKWSKNDKIYRGKKARGKKSSQKSLWQSISPELLVQPQ